MGGGFGTEKFVYQKWPDEIFPIANFIFPPTMVPSLWGGGAGPGGGVGGSFYGCQPFILGRTPLQGHWSPNPPCKT